MPNKDEIAVKSPVRHRLPSFTDSLIEPLSRLRNEVDRLFDDFPARWSPLHFSRMASALPMPAVDVTETDKAYKLSVEVPGMAASDIQVEIDENMIVISGEKREEREEQEKDFAYSERSYGAFERRLELPPGSDPQNIKAKMRNGVLQLTLGKNQKTVANKRKIEVEGA
jgi:HSP20 family protein